MSGHRDAAKQHAVHGTGGGGGGRPLMILLATASVAVILFAIWLHFSTREDRQLTSSDSPAAARIQANAVEQSAGPLRKPSDYLGPEACAECHAQRFEEFRQTNHYRTCRVPVMADLPPGFEPGRGVYQPRFPGVRFEMVRSDDGQQIFQTTSRTSGTQTESQRTRIDLILGAGQADDVYLAWHDDGRLFELPIAWLWPENRWGASHFLHAGGHGDFSRAMTVRCMECHTTHLDYEAGSINRYRRDSIIPGVTCERCHGPGREHVDYHRTPAARDTASDSAQADPIIVPSALERERLIETCTQCHSNATLHRRPPFTYRPGEPLDDYYRTLQISHPEDDHVANQIDRLRKSECFQHSTSMTCITCHDPHHRRDPAADRSAACYQCHQADDCGEQSRLPETLRGECVACHMPNRVKINVKFETEVDNFVPPTTRAVHRIAVDPVARDEVLMRWHRSQNGPEHQAAADELASALLQHWEGQVGEFLGQHRYLAAIAAVREQKLIAVQDRDASERVQQKLSEIIRIQERLYNDWAQALTEIERRRPQQAIELLQDLLEIRPEDAEIHSKLGTLYAMTGQYALAEPHLQNVLRFDPNNPSGLGVLGRIAWLQQDFPAAQRYWQAASDLEPYNAQLHYDLGLTCSRLKTHDQAIAHLQQANTIDPQRPELLVALVDVLVDAGKISDAIAACEEADQRPWKDDAEWLSRFRDRAIQLRAVMQSALLRQERQD